MFRNEVVRKLTCAVLALAFFVIGCGGHVANPVDRYMPGDEKKSCSALLAEITSIDDEIAMKEQKRKERDTWNILEFIGGCLIIVPFFFMDAKGAQEVEIDALKARQKNLKVYFAEKECSVADPSLDPSETLEE